MSKTQRFEYACVYCRETKMFTLKQIDRHRKKHGLPSQNGKLDL